MFRDDRRQGHRGRARLAALVGGSTGALIRSALLRPAFEPAFGALRPEGLSVASFHDRSSGDRCSESFRRGARGLSRAPSRKRWDKERTLQAGRPRGNRRRWELRSASRCRVRDRLRDRHADHWPYRRTRRRDRCERIRQRDRVLFRPEIPAAGPVHRVERGRASGHRSKGECSKGGSKSGLEMRAQRRWRR